MKRCSCCGEHKVVAEFSPDSRLKSGLRSSCKACQCAKSKARVAADPQQARQRRKSSYWANPELARARSAHSYYANPAVSNERARQWQSVNRERHTETRRLWVERNRGVVNAHQAKRRADMITATPAWANGFFIEETYRLAALRSAVTGFPWHVDHLVPLKSDRVCGLHCEANLQVIPADQNVRKNNLYWPNMPEEIA